MVNVGDRGIRGKVQSRGARVRNSGGLCGGKGRVEFGGSYTAGRRVARAIVKFAPPFGGRLVWFTCGGGRSRSRGRGRG